MTSNKVDQLSSWVLFTLGCIDLVRGTLHTFFVAWAAKTFAHLDLTSARTDQLWLLGLFGISNFLTGALYILISRQAKVISGYVLGIIPFAYGLGWVGLHLISGITINFTPDGLYFLSVYFSICLLTCAHFLFRKHFC